MCLKNIAAGDYLISHHFSDEKVEAKTGCRISQQSPDSEKRAEIRTLYGLQMLSLFLLCLFSIADASLFNAFSSMQFNLMQ